MPKWTGLALSSMVLLQFALPVVAAERPSAGAVAGLQDVFVPDPNAGADYVATLQVARGSGRPGDDRHVVSRRGAWLRVDKTQAGRTSTDYVGLVTGTWVIAPDPTASTSGLQITRLGKPATYLDTLSRKTDEQDEVLGETCAVWDVYRSADQRGPTFRRLGCVTADGVEVWRRTIGSKETFMNAAQAIRVERRSVASTFAEPPRGLLELKSWLATPSEPARAQGDFDVLLATERKGEAIRIRRHGSWAYEDMVGWSGRSITSRRLDGRVTLRLHLDREGAGDILAFRRGKASAFEDPQPMARPPEVVLGEPCRWFDLAAGTADAGRTECRASDGAPLKIVLTAWANETVHVAQKVSRRRLEDDDVLPPPEFLTRRLWGLPD